MSLEDAICANDVEALKRFSRHRGGFQTAEKRREAWPLLLGVDKYKTVDYRGYHQESVNDDDAQLRCDVARSMWNVDDTEQWCDAMRSTRRMTLYHIIGAIMSRNPALHYYQGFHDVVSVFILVLEDDHTAFQVAEAAALRFFGDCMRKDFTIISEVMNLNLLLTQH